MLHCWSIKTTVVSKSSYDSILDFFRERDIEIFAANSCTPLAEARTTF